jgi:SAM-dependent methyltransferase
MRKLVGPTRIRDYDNPQKKMIFRFLNKDDYKRVFDFGCGCGRLARQLLMQKFMPEKYTGIDLHRGMIDWCKRNLSPINENFKFQHYNAFNISFNRWGTSKLLSFPAESNQYTLALAHSVFTHITQESAEFYLTEIARILENDGVFYASWFLFEKIYFPMMQEFQNSLYINVSDPTNAVIYDKKWILRAYLKHGLSIEMIQPPIKRGFQWVIVARKTKRRHRVTFPQDNAPFGIIRASLLNKDPHRIGA